MECLEVAGLQSSSDESTSLPQSRDIGLKEDRLIHPSTVPHQNKTCGKDRKFRTDVQLRHLWCLSARVESRSCFEEFSHSINCVHDNKVSCQDTQAEDRPCRRSDSDTCFIGYEQVKRYIPYFLLKVVKSSHAFALEGIASALPSIGSLEGPGNLLVDGRSKKKRRIVKESRKGTTAEGERKSMSKEEVLGKMILLARYHCTSPN